MCLGNKGHFLAAPEIVEDQDKEDLYRDFNEK